MNMSKRIQKEWSQVVFFNREGEDIEALVEGYLGEKLVLTKVTYMDTGNKLALSPEETRQARECLYDSIVNPSGSCR